MKKGAAVPVLDFPAVHGFVVILKALKVDNQHVRQHLDAIALYRVHLGTSQTSAIMPSYDHTKCSTEF